jgi:tellurite resistance protein TerC
MIIFGHELWVWVAFNALIIVLLIVDLRVFHRRAHEVRIREALLWSAVWIALSLLFNVGLYFWLGSAAALQFLTGYLIEKSLSVDNLFVFLLIFSYFKVPPRYQHRVLFYGILGALIMRSTLIAVGVTLIHQFHWIFYAFGLFLIYAGTRMALQPQETEINPERNIGVRLVRRLFPLSPRYSGGAFFVTKEGKRSATLLFLVLVMVETTDLVFALDSIPAIFAITTDPFIVYTSNIFAILGLRALYFALKGLMDLFHYLKLGISLILVLIGLKMLIVDIVSIPTWISLIGVAGILTVSVAASILAPRRPAALGGSTTGEEPGSEESSTRNS